MTASESLMELVEVVAAGSTRAEYLGESVAAGYLDAAWGMLLAEAKRLKAEEDAAEAGE